MATFRDQAKTTLMEAVSTALRRPLDELGEDTQIIADLGAKSVDIVRIIGSLEDEFELEIPFMEFRRKKSIGEAIDYVVSLYEN
jgi:acyl carrier protein